METKRSAPSNIKKLHILVVFIAQSSALGFESSLPKIKEKRRLVRAFTHNTPLGDPGRACGQPEVKTASPEPAMAMVWAVDEEAVLRVDNPIFESEFRENRLFNPETEHTARTAPVQWTQTCQPRPDPAVEHPSGHCVGTRI